MVLVLDQKDSLDSIPLDFQDPKEWSVGVICWPEKNLPEGETVFRKRCKHLRGRFEKKLGLLKLEIVFSRFSWWFFLVWAETNLFHISSQILKLFYHPQPSLLPKPLKLLALGYCEPLQSFGAPHIILGIEQWQHLLIPPEHLKEDSSKNCWGEFLAEPQNL